MWALESEYLSLDTWLPTWWRVTLRDSHLQSDIPVPLCRGDNHSYPAGLA